MACRRLCEVCNCAATGLLQQGHLKGALELLKRAEQVAEKSQNDQAITWNNLACYYRRTGKLRTAVSFLERALMIEEFVRDADAAQTHLNLCATLSQLKRHADALYHAQTAVIRMYELLSLPAAARSSSPSSGRSRRNAAGQEPGHGEDEAAKKEEPTEQATVLCIAYHNLAVEHEYLKNYEAAIHAYAMGMRWASSLLSERHQLVGILRGSVEAVKGKVPPGSAAMRQAMGLLAAAGGAARPRRRREAGGRGCRWSTA